VTKVPNLITHILLTTDKSLTNADFAAGQVVVDRTMVR
jgi:hypothetical protein